MLLTGAHVRDWSKHFAGPNAKPQAILRRIHEEPGPSFPQQHQISRPKPAAFQIMKHVDAALSRGSISSSTIYTTASQPDQQSSYSLSG